MKTINYLKSIKEKRYALMLKREEIELKLALLDAKESSYVTKEQAALSIRVIQNRVWELKKKLNMPLSTDNDSDSKNNIKLLK